MMVLTRDERMILELEMLVIELEKKRNEAVDWIIELTHPEFGHHPLELDQLATRTRTAEALCDQYRKAAQIVKATATCVGWGDGTTIIKGNAFAALMSVLNQVRMPPVVSLPGEEFIPPTILVIPLPKEERDNIEERCVRCDACLGFERICTLCGKEQP